MKEPIIKFLAVPFIGLVLSFSDLHAQWLADTSLNNPICTDTNDQYNPIMVSDGAGGTIIIWQDQRYGPGSYALIYAQRIDVFGQILWTPDGIPVSFDTLHSKEKLTAISDGMGGAIITWEDLRAGNYDIYAQKINGSGVVQWAPEGIPICTVMDYEYYPKIASDGAGGAIITWVDTRYSWLGDIYAQRISSSGNVEWDYNGVPICIITDAQAYPEIISDGNNGAIVTWMDHRVGTDYDIYAQRIDSAGITQWPVNGVPIYTGWGEQRRPYIVSDGWNGGIITWIDRRNGTHYDIFAQKIDLSGSLQWDPNGIPVCTALTDQQEPHIIANGSGGAFITWPDGRDTSNVYLYSQQINSFGTVLWNVDGIKVCNNVGDQFSPAVCSDNLGGAIFSWMDTRIAPDQPNLFAQRMNSSGQQQWPVTGVAISTAPFIQYTPHIISDGYDGAIIAWKDGRIWDDHNIYAQNIGGTGIIGGVISVPEISNNNDAIRIFPNPSNGIIYLQSHQTKLSVKIHKCTGEIVYTNDNLISTSNIDISAFGSGIYFMEISDGENIFLQKHIVNGF